MTAPPPLSLHRKSAFSLVEVTLALGIAAFSLVSILALLPVGIQGGVNAANQSEAARIAQDIVSDITMNEGTGSTLLYGLSLTSTAPVYLHLGDAAINSNRLMGYEIVSTSTTSTTGRFTVQITSGSYAGSTRVGSVRVSWPSKRSANFKHQGSIAVPIVYNLTAPTP